MSAICIQCTTSEKELVFATVKELVEHQRSGHRIIPKIVETPLKNETEKPPEVPKTVDKKEDGLVDQPKKEVKPIILKYKYEGTHDCGNGLDTIEVSVGEKAHMVAYCPVCKVQITSQEVIPIEKQKMMDVPKKELFPQAEFREYSKKKK